MSAALAKSADQIDAEQQDYWNARGGAHWVEECDFTDQFLAGIADIGMRHAKDQIGTRPVGDALDIGCGAGATTLLLQRNFPGSRLHGIDISRPLLSAARQRAAGPITWHLGDAARHDFGPTRFDLMYSRFGVMFFGDPAAAFAHLRQFLAPDGQMVFICWRDFKQNPWMGVPLAAACQHVPWPARPHPDDAGPFSFADPDRVRRICRDAGLADPLLTAHDVKLDLAGGGGLGRAVDHACKIGAASKALADSPPAIVAAARHSMAQALAPYEHDGTVKLDAAIWVVTTHAA